jgi:hypothetical protein
MSSWEHCAAYVALYRDGGSNVTQELLAVQMPGEQRKEAIHPLGIMGLLNQLGEDGWELVDVEGQVFYLKRLKHSAAS